MYEISKMKNVLSKWKIKNPIIIGPITYQNFAIYKVTLVETKMIKSLEIKKIKRKCFKKNEKSIKLIIKWYQ